MNIGQRLLEVRTAKNLSTRDLEVLSGVGKSTISRIEKGQLKTSPATIAKLEKALEIKLTTSIVPEKSFEISTLKMTVSENNIAEGDNKWTAINLMDTQSALTSAPPFISSRPTSNATPTVAELSNSATEVVLKETGAGSQKSHTLPLASKRQPVSAPQFLSMCHDVLRQYNERGFSMLPLWTDYARCVWTLMDELEFTLKAVDFSDEFLSFLKRNRVYVFCVPHRKIVLGIDLPGKGNYIPFGYGSYLRIGEAAYEKRDFCIADMLEKSSIEIKKGF